MAEYFVKIAVIGGGPGGYTAAFRAADLLYSPDINQPQVCIIEQHSALGGVCLNVGCIPSKSLLHIASQIRELEVLKAAGIQAVNEHIDVDLEKLRAYQQESINQLRSGLDFLAKKRNILKIKGTAQFEDKNTIRVGNDLVRFEKCIIATGSKPAALPFLPNHPNVLNSTTALQLNAIPKNLLIIGGGIIGVEMAQIYSALGSKVSIIEMSPAILNFIDSDLTQPLIESFKKHNVRMIVAAKLESVQPQDAEFEVSWINNDSTKETQVFDYILQAVGRKPATQALSCDKIGLNCSSKGFIIVDERMQTNLPNIYAIGDCVGDPMLAHKSSAQAKVAAENAAGFASFYRPECLPSVVYTTPEIAWVGWTEHALIEKGQPYEKATFPWRANGRAIATRSSAGLTKVLTDPHSDRILGAGITGVHAGDLISEFSLAIEMGARVSDLSLTIHPHPTYAETLAHACEMLDGTVTEVLQQKKNKS
ncbi:MAG: dihydrolipoyl dehydrogenase [Gammaproteobacteria bacterium]|nr:dihydrolipoyl dehydrogenase [Gammaproteobacteria bacterium]